MRILLVMAVFVLSLQAKAFFSNSNQAEASQYMNALKDLIVSTQRTRGATASYINGNEAAIDLVYNHRSGMKKAIGEMESLPFAQNPVINARAASVTSSLISLNNKALDLTSKESFDQYTENLSQALMLAQTVSKQFKNLNDFGKEAVDLMLNVILPLSEEMGQLRALGSGAAARKSLTKKQRAHIKAKLNNIRALSATLQANGSALYSKYKEAYSTDITSRLMQASAAANGLIRLTQDEILNADKITYNSSRYFGFATNAVDDVVIIFDINSRAVLKDSDGWL
jgi:methyl-accepting chemotaxis protein